MTPWLSDPEHWRFRAEEARAVADEMKAEEARKTMLQVAQAYDRLAKMAEDLLPKPKFNGWRRRI